MAKRLSALFSAILIFILCISEAVYAASLQEVNIRQLYLYTDVMHTYVEMNDANGQPISTPEANHIFASLDTGRMGVKSIKPFSESGEGMAYVFLIDVSGSLSSSQFKSLKNATKVWAEKMDEKDRLAIITFGNEAKIIQDYTNDAEAIENSLSSISNRDGNTMLYGGIEEAVKLASRNDADLPKRKAVILLTDGVNDYSGGIDETTAMQMATEALIPIYSIWTPGSKSKIGETFLNTLSNATNGTVYNLAREDIDSIYNTAYEGFRKAFVVDLSYPLASADGNIHNLKITVRSEDKEASDDTECILKKPTETYASVPINTVSAEAEEEGENNMSPITLILIIAITLLIIAVVVAIIALMNRKPKTLESSSRAAYPQYTPENANIPIPQPAAPSVPANSGRGIAFTMYEIGKQDVKSGRVDGTIIIGRHSNCGMVINDAGISGQHCRILEDGGALMIEDLGSTNGTIVNGMTIPGRTKLTSGDLIMLGNKEYRISF